MKNVDISKKLDTIQEWSKLNDIVIFYGEAELSDHSVVTWNGSNENSLEAFLSSIKRLGVKLLVVDILKCEVEINEERVKSYKSSLDPDDLLNFESAVDVVEQNKGLLISIDLVFFYDGVAYDFSERVEWIENYYTLLDVMSNEDNDVAALDLEKEARFDEARIRELALEFTSNEDYLKAKSPILRAAVIESCAQKSGILARYNIFRIKLRAESIFNADIKPKQDKETSRRVLELKESGLKKVEIASKLGITVGMVNKFYYSGE